MYTSSMDVVVDGRSPIVEGDESLPYSARLPRAAYSRLKIVSERMVLAANGPDFATYVLRPVGMYGPRDKYHLGNIVAMAQKGVSLRLGDGAARFSHACSENVAHAHVLAAKRLALALASVAGIVAPFSNFNRFSVIQTCVDQTFSYARAEQDLGYRPVVSLAWLRERAASA